ncbi:MAG: sulfatase-like hydrolase/transferase [Actinomycetota bacterium]
MTEARARNVVVICADELNARCLASAGHRHVRTPNIDGLAAQGTSFERAWTPSPICVPARASLATGRWVHDLEAWDSAAPYTGAVRGWAHAARDAGAHAVSIGKLHFRAENDDYGFTESLLPMHVVNGVGWVQGLPRRDPFPYDHATEMADHCAVGESTYTRYDHAITDRTVSWIEANAGGSTPFALFVSLVAPHFPLTVMEEFVAPYLDLDLELEIPAQPLDHPAVAAMADVLGYHRHFTTPDATRFGRQLYLGLVTWLDHNVGRVLRALSAAGASDDTVVLFTSDHGDMIGNRGLWAKSYLYRDSVDVPMIVAGPGVPHGVDALTAVNLVDVAPTILDVVAPGEPYDGPGRSLVDLARTADPHRVGFSEYHDGGSVTGSFAVGFGDYKYVHHVGFEPQLFDVAADPDELDDLAGSASHADARATGESILRDLVDPDDTDRRAFASQAERIAAFGGREALLTAFLFDHTPAPQV